MTIVAWIPLFIGYEMLRSNTGCKMSINKRDDKENEEKDKRMCMYVAIVTTNVGLLTNGIFPIKNLKTRHKYEGNVPK